MHAAPWTLDLQVDAESRLAKLQQHVPFGQIATDIATSLTVLCCHISQVAGTGFRRPVYSVAVNRDLFDQFFNSATGYRAEYFRSPWAGLRANTTFMRAVSPALLGSGPSEALGLHVDFIRESLATPSAKVWLAENGKEVDPSCPGCQGEWSTASVGNPRVAEIRNNRWDVAQGVKSEWGRKAPYLTKLRIMGAFLDGQLNEFVPFDKRFRADEIHQFGWS